MKIERQELFQALGRLRRRLLMMIGTLILLSLLLFPFSKEILRWLHRPLQEDLVAYGIPEAFLSLLKVTVFSSLFLSMPLLFFFLWRAFSPLFLRRGLKSSVLIPLSAIFLFYGGALFCYFLTLPFGIRFLMGYQSETIRPMISVGKFLSFCVTFIFAFGLLFELPLLLALLSYLGAIHASFLARHRRYAILLIAILSALLTPTPDVFNMALMGGPLYLLFEIGLILARVIEKRKPPPL
ncbi:MAG: twin-arginine translocase subunit TatC [Desulfobacterota bacterium]|nr:twin-arginine translocase subunit TatC [Thermodesulfobacteriota bacterium]